MKKVSLKARFLLLSCLALGGGALSARPAQAEWNVAVTVSGITAAPQTYSDVNGNSIPGNASLDGITVSAYKQVVSPPFPSGSFANDVFVQATLSWTGNDPVPTSVAVDEQIFTDASVGASEAYQSYGQPYPGITFSTSIGGVSRPRTAYGPFAQQTAYSQLPVVYTVTNRTLVLPAKRLKSDLIFDSTVAASIPPNERPTSYLTGWKYGVKIGEDDF